MSVTLDAIARPSGALAMVAMDQRESLRTMFVHAGLPETTPAELTQFKCSVAKVLSPYASGFLIDPEFGYPQVRDEKLVDQHAGLIVAADVLTQEPLGPVTETSLDEEVVADGYDLSSVVALKLLVKWKRDDQRAARVEMSRKFTERCAELGVLSVLEPVVEATPAELEDGSWNMEDAIVEAARELSVVGQSLYKVQVPLHGVPGPVLAEQCSRLAQAITGPWVVLSQGVSQDHFLGAVETACKAGASGFLAGRAIWSDLVGSKNLEEDLTKVSIPRLEALGKIVDTYATPWSEQK